MTTLLVALVIGILFGALLQRVGASKPDLIVEALRLRDLTILKFMALAIGVAAAGMGVLGAAGAGHFAIKPLYVLGVFFGGLVFGVGFAVSGYCPGTSLVAAAEGRRDALFTVAGALAGALAYTLLFPALKPWLVDPWNLGKLTLAGAHPLAAGLSFGAAFVLASLLLPTRPGRSSSRATPGVPAVPVAERRRA